MSKTALEIASDAASGVTGRVFLAEGGEVTLYNPPLPFRTVIKQGIWGADELAGVCESAFGATLPPPAAPDTRRLVIGSEPCSISSVLMIWSRNSGIP